MSGFVIDSSMPLLSPAQLHQPWDESSLQVFSFLALRKVGCNAASESFGCTKSCDLHREGMDPTGGW